MKRLLLTLPLILLAACGQLNQPAAVADVSPPAAMLAAQRLCPGRAVIVRYNYEGPGLILAFYPPGYWIDRTADGHWAIYRWVCDS